VESCSLTAIAATSIALGGSCSLSVAPETVPVCETVAGNQPRALPHPCRCGSH